MAGRDIAVGPRGHSGEQATRHALAVFGLSYDDLGKVNHVGYTDAVSLLKDGHIDAFGVLTSVPSGAIMDTASARPIRLLSISDERLAALQQFNPQYVRRIIPAGAYPGVDEELKTFGKLMFGNDCERGTYEGILWQKCPNMKHKNLHK